jgi:hypothetical protein
MMIYLGRISPEASKMKKSVEEFLYEYVVIYQGDETVTFYSDSAPPHVGPTHRTAAGNSLTRN